MEIRDWKVGEETDGYRIVKLNFFCTFPQAELLAGQPNAGVKIIVHRSKVQVLA